MRNRETRVKRNSARLATWLAAMTMVGIGLAAISGPSAAKGPGRASGRTEAHLTSSPAGSTLTISAAGGEQWPCDFNPLTPNGYGFSLGLVNEELYYVDSLTGKETPWLATAYQFSNDDKTLTWTIRQGVKFSNGEPLTAADVAYTFNLIKQYPALDLNAIYPNLVSTTQTGPYTVVMQFQAPSAFDFYYLADATPIVPEQVWQKVSDPSSYKDTNPIGTGPYTVQSCTPENITYVKNPNYWQPGLPKIDKVELPAILTSQVSNEELADGTAQWGGEFIPDIKQFYLSKNPDYRTWSPPVGVNGMYINLTVPLLSNVAVRQAMAYGINRNTVSEEAESGELAPADQAGVLLPLEQAYYNTALADKYDYHYDPAKAISILEKAGFKRGSDGIFETPSGKPLSFTLIVPGAYADEVAAGQVVSADLAKIGIKITQEDLSTNTRGIDAAEGKFELELQGPPQITLDGPAGILRGLLYSGNSAPIGKPAASDYERYSSPATDALFNELNGTTNVATEESIVKQIEAVMLEDVPFIPLTYAGALNEYNVGFASGWPTPSDPYANPSPTTVPDWEMVLLHLVPKG